MPGPVWLHVAWSEQSSSLIEQGLMEMHAELVLVITPAHPLVHSQAEAACDPKGLLL